MGSSEAHPEMLSTEIQPASDQDVAYAASMFLLASRMAERAIAGAVAADAEVLSRAGTVKWLVDNWTSLVRQAVQVPRIGVEPRTARAPCGQPRSSLTPIRPQTSDVSCPQATAPTRVGLHRCLACGRIGIRGFVAASPLVLPHQARTWRCVDRLACRTRRLERSGPR